MRLNQAQFPKNYWPNGYWPTISTTPVTGSLYVSFIFISGRSLTFSVYMEDGTLKSYINQELPEMGSSGYYVAVPYTHLVDLDIIVVTDSVWGVVGGGQYHPETTVPALQAINTIVTNILNNSSRVVTVYGLDANKPKITSGSIFGVVD